MAGIVLVTEVEFLKAEGVFRAESELDVQCVPIEEDPLAERVRATGARAVIVGVDAYGGPLYEALGETGGSNGAIIARFGVGHDGIDKALARHHHIAVTNTPGVLDASVAEHTMWLIGCLACHIARMDAAFHEGRFAPETGTEIRGKTLGVIGFGAIGRRVAATAHFGFGMRVIAADCRPPAELEEAEGKSMDAIRAAFGLDRYTVDIDAVLREADVVTLHIPASPRTENFLDARRLSLMKPAALLINTSRGLVVDECALHDALANGTLRGAGLDVFKKEPYEPVRPDKDLRTLRNIVLTPHTGADTQEANARMAQASLENVRCFLAGRTSELTRV